MDQALSYCLTTIFLKTGFHFSGSWSSGAAGIDERGQRCGKAGECGAVDLIARALAVRFETDKPGFDQYLQVLGDGGLRQVEMVDDLAAAAGAAGGQMFQDFDPRRMRKGRKPGGDGAAVRRTVGWRTFIYRAASVRFEGGFGHRPSAINDDRSCRKLLSRAEWLCVFYLVLDF
jgi:hypothetical protein